MEQHQRGEYLVLVLQSILSELNTSNESISSIIPFEKKEELSRFEMTLKQMIEEAKQMAATPSGSQENIYASLHKSPSVISVTESIVSVIEQRRPSDPQQNSEVFAMTGKLPIDQIGSGLNPVPPQRPRRNSFSPQQQPDLVAIPPVSAKSPIEQVDAGLNPPQRPPRSPSPRRLSITPQPVQQASPSPTATKLSAPPIHISPVPLASTMEATSNGSLSNNATPQRQSRQSSCNKTISSAEKPLIGADRYEEIIEARGRRGSSVASGPRSVQGSMTNLFQPNSTMAMREETRQPSMSKASSRQGSTNKLNQITAMSNQNETQLLRPTSASSLTGLSEGSNLTTSSSSVHAPSSPVKPSTPVIAPVVRTSTLIKPKETFIIKEAPPAIAPTISAPSKFEPKIIEPSIDPLRPEILAEMEAKRPPKKSSVIPDWLIITLTYSVVFITILLLSNITPHGKLYIHFTAFFSMILYFITDDVEQKKMDTIVDNLVKVQK